ncbi:HD domain-containing protein [Streptomyces sp. NPDC002285]
MASATYPDALLAHCLRSWLLGDLIAQLDQIAFDPELLYIACLLHDLALTESHRPTARDRCFAVHGGTVARDLLADWGAEPAFAEQVAEAITLHMNAQVPVGRGAEAHLLHDAAHLDVVGTRLTEIPRSALRSVVRAHPRQGFAAEFGRLMKHEAATRPRSRAALGWRMGMRLPLHCNPLDRISMENTASSRGSVTPPC